MVEELVRRGEEHKVFDLATFSASCTLTVENAANTLVSHLHGDGADLDLNTVLSVWLRRPGEFRLPGKLLPGEEKWLMGAVERAWRPEARYVTGQATDPVREQLATV